jgi:hypothetical protein
MSTVNTNKYKNLNNQYMPNQLDLINRNRESEGGGKNLGTCQIWFAILVI